MIDILAFCILIIVVGYQGVFIFLQKRAYDKKETELLNRIMARDFENYVQGEVAQTRNPLTPEEIYAMQQERGIPV